MNIYILDGLAGISGVIETYESVIWNMQFSGVNDFQIQLPLSAGALLTRGTCLVRETDVTANGYRNVMRIESRVVSYDADRGWILTVSGGGLKKIVGQRVVWEQTNFEEENVETAIRSVITDNIISPDDTDRAIGDFILADAVGLTDTFDAQLFGDNIADWIQSTCEVYGCGWDVYIENGKYVFALIYPTDRSYDSEDPVVFSPEFDNLAAATYENLGNEAYNVALVGGEGEGTEQVTTSVGSGAGLGRYETYIDGGSVSSNGEIITMETYISMLQTYGTEQMTQSHESVSGEIIQNGLYTFGVDYFLGDIVQVNVGAVASAKMRITEMIYSEDVNGSALVPTFEEV